jgi:uncharacterized protein YbjT (DUF2867 family)
LKQQGKTMVPRKEDLNKALVEAGHKIHADARTKKLARDKQKKWEDEQEYEWD